MFRVKGPGSQGLAACRIWGPGCFFFVVAPFCSCPASLVSRKFFAVGPGCAKCFFVAEQKQHHPGCFFFAPAPGKGRGRRSAVRRRHGARAKKKSTQGFFFAAAPAKGKGRRSPVGSRHGARAKKKNTTQGVFFFAPAPGKGRGRRSPVGRRGFSFPCRSRGRSKKKTPWVVFFFCSGPVPAPNGASPSLAFRRGRSKKKHPGWCFFFCSGHVPAPNGASPSRAFRRGRSKKKYPGWCFFFAAAPRGRSLTHCGPGWRCLPFGGVVFFFLLRGGVFFCCGPARTLTHSRWAGAISARPGWCFFFAAAPPGLFRQ